MSWAPVSLDAGASRAEQLREVLVFLFLIAPSMGLSFFAIRQGTLSFQLTASATILRDLGLVGLIVFFLWRNREPMERIGWTFANGWRDAMLGIVLFMLMSYATAALEKILKDAGFTAPATPLPHSLTAGNPAEFVLAGVLVIVVAIAEEIIFRGYLILRLRTITGSTLFAATLSAIIFSLGHGYEGTAGVIVVGFMGLFFAFAYLSRKSLVAPIVMHFLQDFTGIVVVPLLKHRS
ncbi:MAG TPA: type II CAAX endopeptidase family protein [Bryobacteraceae bacterium]|jgi:membrane protease YdiL (CAAX protease family)